MSEAGCHRQALLPLQQIKVLPHYSSRRNKCLGSLKFSNALVLEGQNDNVSRAFRLIFPKPAHANAIAAFKKTDSAKESGCERTCGLQRTGVLGTR